MRRRVRFELQLGDLGGLLPDDAALGDARLVRISVDHLSGKKAYATTQPLSLGAGAPSPPQSVAWECSVHPGKAVQLGLLVSASAADAPAALRSDVATPPHTPTRRGILSRISISRAVSWQQLASTTLALAPLVPAASREASGPLGSLADAASGELTPCALASRRTSLQSNSISTAAPGHAAGRDGGGCDRPSPFLALATGDDGQQAFGGSDLEQPQQHHHETPSSLASAFRGRQGALRASVDDATAGSSPDVSRQLPALDVAGLWAVGSTQVARCTLHWLVVGSGQDVAQEVVVVAQLLEERPSFSNIFGLLSKEGSSQAGSSGNLRGMQSGGSASPAAPGRSRLWGSSSSLVAAASGGTTDQAAGATGPPARAVDASSQPDAGLSTGPAPAQDNTRRVTFDAAPPTSTAAAVPVTPTKSAEAEAEEEAEEQAKRDFLTLIMSTLSSAASVESEAGLPALPGGTSAAQLAAAASLPRKPSTADLALFAAAAGLPIETVNSAAAATRLAVSTGGHDSSRRSSPESSRGSPTRQRPLLPPLPASAADHNGPAAAAAPIVAAAAAEAATAGAEAAVSGPPAAHGPAAVVVDSASIRPGVQTVAAPAHSPATPGCPAHAHTMAAAAPGGAVISATALADAGPADVGSVSGWEPRAVTVATVTAAAVPHSSSTPDDQPGADTSAATLLVTTEPGDVCGKAVDAGTHGADDAGAALAVASGSVRMGAPADSGAEQPEASTAHQGGGAAQGMAPADDADEAVVPPVVQLPLEASPPRERCQAPSTPLPTEEQNDADAEPPSQPEPASETAGMQEPAPAPLDQHPLPATSPQPSQAAHGSAEGGDDDGGGDSSSASCDGSSCSSSTSVGRGFGDATSADADSPLKGLSLCYNQLFEATDNAKASLQQWRAARSNDQGAQPLETDQAGPSGLPQSAAPDTTAAAPAEGNSSSTGSQSELPAAPAALAPAGIPEIQPADDDMQPGLGNGAPQQQQLDLDRTHSRLAAVLDSASSTGSGAASSSLLPGMLAAGSAAAGSVALAAGSAAAAVLPAGVSLAVFTTGQMSGVVSSAVSAGMSAALYVPVAAARTSMQLAGGAASAAVASLASKSSAAQQPEARGTSSWGALLFSPFSTREASAPAPCPAPAAEHTPNGSSMSPATALDRHITGSSAAAAPPRSQAVRPARSMELAGTWAPGLVSYARAYVALWLWLFTLVASAPLNLALQALRFVTAPRGPSSATAASTVTAAGASHAQQREQEEAPTPFETAQPEQDAPEHEGRPDSRPDSTTLGTSGSSGLLAGGSFMRRRLPSRLPATPAPSLEATSLKAAAPERSWSSLLSAALSRMSSSSLAATGSADTPPAAHGPTLPAAAPAPAARTQGRPLRLRLLPAARSRLGRCHAGRSSASAVLASPDASIDETAELPAPPPLVQHTSSAAADSPVEAAGSGTSSSRGWWPMSLMAWRAADNGGSVPATPPPSAASSSASAELGQTREPDSETSAAAVVVLPSDSSERRSSSTAHAQPHAQSLFGVLRDAASGAGHLTSAAGHLMLAADLLLVEPVVWWAHTLVTLALSGVSTAAWLIEWAWWWAVLPGRLAWWWAAAVCRLLAWPLTRRGTRVMR